ncbi:hypothetical protein ACL9RF_17220 [Sphingobacterium sp. Mn56C]|uniref:hypothetical protein n=1 Tax=Sphingobacterium sp. Mn56C TaxID=3395261 RepID=UPI003BE8B54F
MKRIFLATVAMLISGLSYGQHYKNSIGIRLADGGYYNSASVAFKTFITQPGALEFDLGFDSNKWHGDRYQNVALSGTYQHHFQIGTIPGFKWFVGGGLILSNTFVKDSDLEGGFNAGLYPTGGIDYKLKKAPFAFSADIRPTVHIVRGYDRYDGFYANGGLTARYTF